MIRARIVVKGRVQKAGYRDFVDEVAYHLNLKGYIKNLPDRTVEVVCEGRKENIEKFAAQIKIKEYPIRVDKVDITYSKATREFKDFDIIREEDITEATYERMDEAARCLRELGRDLGEKIEKAGNKVGAMHEDTNIRFDQMAKRDQEILKEIASMHKDTNERFDVMAKRYDLISKGLIQAIKMMRVEFTRSRKETREEFTKSRKESAKAYNNLSRAINNLTSAIRIGMRKK